MEQRSATGRRSTDGVRPTASGSTAQPGGALTILGFDSLTQSPDSRSDLDVEGPSASSTAAQRTALNRGSRMQWEGQTVRGHDLDDGSLFPPQPVFHYEPPARSQQPGGAVAGEDASEEGALGRRRRGRTAPRRRAEVVIVSPPPQSPETGNTPEAAFTSFSVPEEGDATIEATAGRLARSRSRSRPYSPPPELPPTPPQGSRRSSRSRSRHMSPPLSEYPEDSASVLEGLSWGDIESYHEDCPDSEDELSWADIVEGGGSDVAGREGQVDEEDDEDLTLFMTSLRNGQQSRDRRRLRATITRHLNGGADGPEIDEDVLNMALGFADPDRPASGQAGPGQAQQLERPMQDFIQRQLERREHRNPLEASDEFDWRRDVAAATSNNQAPGGSTTRALPAERSSTVWRGLLANRAEQRIAGGMDRETVSRDLRAQLARYHEDRQRASGDVAEAGRSHEWPAIPPEWPTTDASQARQPLARATADLRAQNGIRPIPSRVTAEPRHSQPWTGRRAHAAQRDLEGKPVLVLYCGGPSRAAKLPAGFQPVPPSPSTSSSSSAEAARPASPENAGCGAVLCVRAATQPFVVCPASGGGKRKMIYSSDAPPVRGAVGRVDEESRRQQSFFDGGEAGCRCEDRQFGCLACGHIVGFQSLDFCPRCASRSQPGHRFLFSADRVTCLPRNADGSVPSLDGASARSFDIGSLLGSADSDGDGEGRFGGIMRWNDVPGVRHDMTRGLVQGPHDWTSSLGSPTFDGLPRSSGSDVQRRASIPARRRWNAALAPEAESGSTWSRSHVHGAIGEERSAARRPSSTIASLFSRVSPPPAPILEDGGGLDAADSTGLLARGTSLSRSPAMRLRRDRASAIAALDAASPTATVPTVRSGTASSPGDRPRERLQGIASTLGPFPTSHSRSSRLFESEAAPGDLEGRPPSSFWELPPPTGDRNADSRPSDSRGEGQDTFGYGTLFNFAVDAFQNRPAADGDSSGLVVGPYWTSSTATRADLEAKAQEERDREDALWEESWPRQRRRTESHVDTNGPVPRRTAGSFMWTGDVCAR